MLVPFPARVNVMRSIDIDSASSSEERASAPQLAEGRYRSVFEGAPLPAWLVDRDSGAILDANAEAARASGFARDELLAKNARSLWPRLAGAEADDGAAEAATWLRRKDGVEVEVTLRFSELTLDGRAVRVAIATPRPAVDERADERAAWLAAAHDAIVVTDVNEVIRYLNPAAERLFGGIGEGAVGARIGALLALEPEGDGADAAAESPFAIALSRGTWKGELVLRPSGAGAGVFATRITLVRDATDTPRSLLVILSDVTEQRRLEQQYARALRMESIGTLASGIAHDLNNVLAPIMMSIDLVRLGPMSRELAETMETIEGAATRGAQMVKQVLSFARGVEGERALVRGDEVLRDVARLVRDTFPKSVKLALDVRAELSPLVGDRAQIHRVLLNLALNARDAMPEGGTLTLSAEEIVLDDAPTRESPDARAGRHVVLSVADTGRGVPAGAREHLFEPFFTTKDVGRGAGLGLATAHAIAKSHGGFIRLENEPGRGARFRVFLPVGASADPPAPGERGPTLPRGGQTILVVDDEPSIRSITKQTLEAFGYRALLASDGADAIATYARNEAEIAAVLTDISMPIMDGATTIQALLRIDPKVRIIAVSGVERGGNVARGQPGVKRFLAKPFTASALLRALAEVLATEGDEA